MPPLEDWSSYSIIKQREMIDEAVRFMQELTADNNATSPANLGNQGTPEGRNLVWKQLSLQKQSFATSR